MKQKEMDVIKSIKSKVYTLWEHLHNVSDRLPESYPAEGIERKRMKEIEENMLGIEDQVSWFNKQVLIGDYIGAKDTLGLFVMQFYEEIKVFMEIVNEDESLRSSFPFEALFNMCTEFEALIIDEAWV